MSAALLTAAKAADEQINSIRATFGAPGDYGYESREGQALFALYKFQMELRAAIAKAAGKPVVSTLSVCGPRGEMCPVEGIRLRKSGECTVVDAEIGGSWIEVIRERSDGEFCHIVEPAGMFSAYYALPPGPHQ